MGRDTVGMADTARLRRRLDATRAALAVLVEAVVKVSTTSAPQAHEALKLAEVARKMLRED